MFTAGQECSSRLKERIDTKEYVEKKSGETAPGQFDCCYFAEFSHCFSSMTREACGDDVSEKAASFLDKGLQLVASKCKEYDYYSATCLFVIYLNYIIIAAVIFVLLSLGCCLAKCFC